MHCNAVYLCFCYSFFVFPLSTKSSLTWFWSEIVVWFTMWYLLTSVPIIFNLWTKVTACDKQFACMHTMQRTKKKAMKTKAGARVPNFQPINGKTLPNRIIYNFIFNCFTSISVQENNDWTLPLELKLISLLLLFFAKLCKGNHRNKCTALLCSPREKNGFSTAEFTRRQQTLIAYHCIHMQNANKKMHTFGGISFNRRHKIMHNFRIIMRKPCALRTN